VTDPTAITTRRSNGDVLSRSSRIPSASAVVRLENTSRRRTQRQAAARDQGEVAAAADDPRRGVTREQQVRGSRGEGRVHDLHSRRERDDDRDVVASFGFTTCTRSSITSPVPRENSTGSDRSLRTVWLSHGGPSVPHIRPALG
jgi:hypothetical protein